ncbi:MAG: hypothetical protein RL076_911 [Chloroflexota bacterium]|jgi:cytidine deaminase
MSQINSQHLIDAAITARTHAYAPYSRFLVGAAVLCSDGRIFMGCNIENAAYPSTNCAERVAMQSAWAVGARDIVAIAVVADTPGPVSPCGGCRQVMAELARNAVVYLTNLHGQVYETSVAALLPGAFDPNDLPQ